MRNSDLLYKKYKIDDIKLHMRNQQNIPYCKKEIAYLIDDIKNDLAKEGDNGFEAKQNSIKYLEWLSTGGIEYARDMFRDVKRKHARPPEISIKISRSQGINNAFCTIRREDYYKPYNSKDFT